MSELPVAALRAASWLAPATAVACALAARTPSRRSGAAATAATCWCLSGLLALAFAAERSGWWRFHASGGLIADMPVETWLGWAIAWGALPALLFDRIRVAPLLAAMLAWDLVAMPRLAPLLSLGPSWLAGELLGLACVFAPALWLARLTLESRGVRVRAVLQAVAFSGVTFFVIAVAAHRDPAVGFLDSLRAVGFPDHALVALAGPPALLALAAVAEFAERGGGTPLPLDPPQRLVVSGPYAFVRNPMQLGASALIGIEAIWLESPWLAAAVPLSVIYSAGFAAIDERIDLRERFGDAYESYRARVRAWLPRWRPYRHAPATLYFGAGCDMCEDVARFLTRLAPLALRFVAADEYSPRALARLVYRDGDYEADGVRAIARALEHTTLPLALLGFAMRAPGIATALQWIVDASGGGPRQLAQRSGR